MQTDRLGVMSRAPGGTHHRPPHRKEPDMTIDNALASVAVKDVDKSAAWYAELLGSKGHRPMPEVEEWMFPRGGGLQVYQGLERAGHCSFTLAVSDLETVASKLAAMGVAPGARTSSERIKTLMVTDPDGNSIAIAEALDPAFAK
jgi:predicted enzyme related to lactoylglutathione lyase